MFAFNQSISNLCQSLHPTLEERRKSETLNDLASDIHTLCKGQNETNIPLNKNFFQGQTNRVAINIVNAKQINGIYFCSLIYNQLPCTISQSVDNLTEINVCSGYANATVRLKNASFPKLQKHMLMLYIEEQISSGNVPVDLSLFNLNGTDLSGVDFTNTELSRKNIDAIIASKGDLAGAVIKIDADVNGLLWDGVTLDKAMVYSLIAAGADFKSVLISYLATEPCLGSSLFKSNVLNQYLDLQRSKNTRPIELSDFNLMDVKVRHIDFFSTVLSQANLDVVVANGGNLRGASLSEGASSAHLHCLDNVALDKNMAMQLLSSGANPQTVLTNFLVSECRLKNEPDLLEQTTQITKNIINTKLNDDGTYACLISFCERKFSIIHTTFPTTQSVIHDVNTNEKIVVENTSFPELQKHLLKLFITEQYSQDNLAIDLTQFNLSGMDLSDIDFTSTVLSKENFEEIVAGKGDLANATIAIDTDVTDLPLDGVRLGENMANSLITAGADFKSVLISYLATTPCLGSSIHQSAMFRQYLEIRRKNGTIPIDLSEFNLGGVKVRDIDFSETILSQDKLNIIVANSGNLSGATLAKGTSARSLHFLDNVAMDKNMAIQLIAAGGNQRTVLINYLATQRSLGHVDIDISGIDLTNIDSRSIDWRDVDLKGIQFVKPPNLTATDIQKLQANFGNDLLTMLTVYSQTVASVVTKSSTRDVVNHVPYITHSGIINYIREHNYRSERLRATLKTSTGNCAEMAQIGKCMMDLYLKESLTILGYKNFSFTSSLIKAEKPADHAAIMLLCELQGAHMQFIVDPWSDGKAWTEKDGLHYFRTEIPNEYTNSNMLFLDNDEENVHLEKPGLRSKVSIIFDQFQIKTQLNLAIKDKKNHFIGSTIG